MSRTLRYALVAMGAGVGCLALVLGGSALAGGEDCAGEGEGHGEAHAPYAYAVALGDEDGGRGFLGVSVEEEIENPEGGARITTVYEDSAAEKAGLEEGDIIVGFAGKPVRGPGSLSAKLRETEPGDSVKVEVVRGGRKQTFTVELADRAAALKLVAPMAFEWDSGEWQENMEKLGKEFKELKVFPKIQGGWVFGSSRPKLGVQLVETTPELRVFLGSSEDNGVLVGSVMNDMPAKAAGIQVGDLIIAVDGQEIEGAGELIEALSDKDGQTIRVDVVRDHQVKTIQVAIPEQESEDEADGPRASLDEGLTQRLVADAMRLARVETRQATREAVKAYREALRLSAGEVRRAIAEARAAANAV